MTTFAASKVLSSLPQTLAPDTVYFVRVGVGIDIYVTDSTGEIAYGLNAPNAITIRTTRTAAYSFVATDIGACTPFNLSAAADATIPSGITTTIGALLYVAQDGSDPVTLVAGSGVVLNAENGATTSAKGDWRCAIFRGNDGANDVWDVL